MSPGAGVNPRLEVSSPCLCLESNPAILLIANHFASKLPFYLFFVIPAHFHDCRLATLWSSNRRHERCPTKWIGLCVTVRTCRPFLLNFYVRNFLQFLRILLSRRKTPPSPTYAKYSHFIRCYIPCVVDNFVFTSSFFFFFLHGCTAQCGPSSP